MHVDLDDAGIRRHVENPDARIARRRVALDHDRLPAFRRRGLDVGEELDVILEAHQRRHEHVEMAVAHFDAQRRLDHVPRRQRCRLRGRFTVRFASAVATAASSSRGAKGSTGISGSTSSGRTSGSDASGNLRPMRRIARAAGKAVRASDGHGLLRQAWRIVAVGRRARATAARTRPVDRVPAAGAARDGRARRSSPRSASSGSTLAGSAASVARSFGTSSNAVITQEASRPRRCASPVTKRCADGEIGAALGRAYRPSMRDRPIAAARRSATRRRCAQRGQRLARIPFPLPCMEKSAGGKARGEPTQQRLRQLAFLRRERGVVPLRALPCRRRTRTSAPRPASGARRASRDPHPPAGRYRESPPTARRSTAW